jgi:alpha,alpha-trehalose phosphorylase
MGANMVRRPLKNGHQCVVFDRSPKMVNDLVKEKASWMMLTYGFGGMRDDDGTLSFWPRRAPEENAILRFPLTYRAQMLEVEIGPETVQYSLREGERLVIHHEKEEIQLTRENPLAVRPVSRR